MKIQAFTLAACAVASVAAQGVTEPISPPGSVPVGCIPSIDGKFEITVVQITDAESRSAALMKRATCSGDGVLVSTLRDTVIKDAFNRTGYIASNFQFQFDNPPQAGAIYTAGFSFCPENSTLALGATTTFYQCRSGDFYNLYDRYWAPQCEPVDIIVIPCNDATENSGAPTQTVIGSATILTTIVIPLSDGQPQVITTDKVIPICQIDDGQIQGHTAPCTGPVATITATPLITQISDGQIQVTGIPATVTVPLVTQISDGQIQAPPATTTPVGPFQPTEAPPANENGAAPLVGGILVGALVAAIIGVALVLLA
ncbi:putative covalently-linked cell wall protein [Thermochaetoides thermophila DSM 1495]|uniref:Putative covalently-linked cell wall protein n=1 Tax=Chaetomium thermophilum (strain DSM 1495 / CBS 144.50 / IMI 039719) TaxID=759272 RepID=G0SEJ6_CHATD|nr:putative covalently-linked cell wall protein [Thermochaetoides thermophila DSM 1495]EGS18373.1 putative covalently-linked cell wall protein [Thermochaetoides thermophila DSM 1495]